MLTSQTLIPWHRPAWKLLNPMLHSRWSRRWEYIRSFHLLTSKHLRQLVTCNSPTCTDMGHCIGPGVSNPAPEEFSSNDTHLNQLIKILRITRNFQASVLGQVISRQWSRIGHPWFSRCHLGNAVKCPFSLKSRLIDLLDFTSQMSTLELHSSCYLQKGFGSIPSSGVYGTHYKLIFSAGWWAIKKDKNNIIEGALQHLKLWRGNTISLDGWQHLEFWHLFDSIVSVACPWSKAMLTEWLILIVCVLAFPALLSGEMNKGAVWF